MLRGWRSARRVPCAYPVLSVVWLLSPSIFLTPSISASAPSNTGFFFSKICASRDQDERDAHILGGSLSLSSLSPAPSLSIHTPCPFPHGVSSIGSFFFPYSLGLVATLPCLVFAIAISFASFAFFIWLRCFSLRPGVLASWSPCEIHL